MSHSQCRREFFRDAMLLAAGAATGTFVPSFAEWMGGTADNALRAAQNDPLRPEQRLRELDIELPPTPTPVAVYVPAVISGNLLFASGHGPRQANGELVTGKVGSQLNLEQAYSAARLVGLNVLSTLRSTLGSLDRIERLVKVLGLVNCVADFDKQPQVINGFSELMVEVFGEQAGKGARSAVGTNSLPSNIPVEIEAIFQIRS